METLAKQPPQAAENKHSTVLEYICSLDLGQTTDFSAFSVIEKRTEVETREETVPVDEPVFHCRSLHRWHLGTPYTTIVDDVVRFMGQAPLAGGILCVDQTGCGRPVVDLLRRQRPKAKLLIPVTITAGQQVSRTPNGDWHVAKVPLISTLLVAQQSDRFRFAKGMREAATLTQELANYRMRVTAALNETFEAREGAHDDLVLSLALGVWWGSRPQRRLRVWT